jgi:hypothetical protein
MIELESPRSRFSVVSRLPAVSEPEEEIEYAAIPAKVIHMPHRPATVRQPTTYHSTPSVLKPSKLGTASEHAGKSGRSGWFDSALIPAFLRANKT